MLQLSFQAELVPFIKLSIRTLTLWMDRPWLIPSQARRVVGYLYTCWDLLGFLDNVPLDLSLLYCNFSNSFFQVWVPVSTNLSKDNPTRNAFWGFGCFILKGCKLRVGQESAKFHTLQNEIRIHVPRKQNKPKNLGLQCLHQPFHLVSTESKEHLWSWQVNGLYFLPVSISTLGTYTTYTCTC